MRQSVKYLVLFFGLLETFVFTGNILGWTGLLYMLKSEEIYAYLCDESITPTEWPNVTKAPMTSSSPTYNGKFFDFRNYSLVTSNVTLKVPRENCDDQERLLNLAFTIGSFCLGSTAFIWGFLLEKWGLRYVRLVINGLLTIGTIMLSLTKEDTSYLIFPSLILMCLAGVPLRLANMQIADLFPEKRSTIITLYSGAFGASASVFVLIKYGYDAGLPWEWACFILVVLSVLMLPVTLFLLPFYRIEEPRKAKQISFKTRAHAEVAGITPSVWGSYILVEDSSYFESNLPAICARSSMDAEKKSINGSVDTYSSNGRSTEELADDHRNKGMPLRTSVMSTSYMMHQYWFCWLLLLTIIYVGTLHVWCSRSFETEEEGAFFAELYGLFQVSGLFLAPIGGLFMDWSIRRASKESDSGIRRLKILQSNFWPITLTTFMAVVVQGAKYFDNGIAIWVSVIFVTLLRTCLLSIGTAYLRIRFPAEHFGRMLGIMSTMSAIFTLLQFPLFIWETNSTANVLQVHIFDTVCLLFACIHPALLLITPLQRRYIQREKTLEQKHHEKSGRF